MSNILDLSQFKSIKELQEYANKQYMTIGVMKQKNDELIEKMKHLESLLASKATVLNVGSEQEEICRIEINRLYQKTMRGPLEFQEVKVLETFTKILLAINGKEVESKQEKATNKALRAMSPEDLIKIALQKTPEDEPS
jgi:hypothetical protein